MGSSFAAAGRYLALDTSGDVGYVAVSSGATVVARTRLDRRGQHAARLVPAVAAMLDEAGLEPRHLDGIVVGDGPGSFTGVRVAAATAKGMAAALRIPLWAVSSLAAAALSDPGSGGPAVRYVLFDARVDRVYAACYGVGSVGVETLVPPHASTLREVLGGGVPAGAEFVGDGAERHRRAIEDVGFPVRVPPHGKPTADALLRFMALCPDTPAVASPGTWEPRYLRAANAEREWTA
jgi:tRNA threonylcarbamoyladenosine biosynthesis protein TsaB